MTFRALTRGAACIAALVPFVVFSTACSNNPYEYEIEAPADLAMYANPVGPEDVKPVSMALMAVQNMAGGEWAGAAANFQGKVRDTIRGGTNVEIVAEGAELDGVIAQLKRSGTALYNPDTAVELGKLSGAQYVAFVKFTGCSASTESYETTAVDTGSVIFSLIEGKNRVTTKTVTRYSVSANVSGDIVVVDVTTGKVVHSKSDRDERSAKAFTYDPGQAGMSEYIGYACHELAVKLVTQLATTWPIMGYISEMRGSQKFCLVETRASATSPEFRQVTQGVDFSVGEPTTKNDPVFGFVKDVQVVGTLSTLFTDQRGTWTKTQTGRGKLCKGHSVRSTGITAITGEGSGIGRGVGSIFG